MTETDSIFDPPPAIGLCIYCGSQGPRLQDEHVIPYGLNGTWKLLAASCPTCADITSRFERLVLRDGFLATRTALGFRSYRPKQRPQELPLEVERGRGREVLNLPIEDHPAILAMPRFPLPSWIESRTTRHAIEPIGAVPAHFGLIDPIAFTRRYADPGLKVSVPLVDPVAFARLIAKIAYCYCVARFGLAALKECHVLPAIRGETDDVGTWVGSMEDEHLHFSPPPDTRVNHVVATDVHAGDILAYVRLFAWAMPTEYVVVVARAPEGHVDEAAHGRQFPPSHGQ